MIDRRAFLAGMAVAGLAAPSSALERRKRFFTTAARPIGIQMYTVADLAKADLAGTLKAIARMGYGEVELAGLLGYPATEWRRLLTRNRLRARSAHVAFDGDPVNLGEGVARVADALAPIGIRTAVMSFPPPIAGLERGATEDFFAYVARLAETTTADDWRRIADVLNTKGAQLARRGLRLAYHNHNIELAPKAASCGLEILIRHTDPALVDFELDAGWVKAAGGDPGAWLARWPGRFRLMHIKDVAAGSAPNYALRMEAREIGRGSIDWPTVLAAASKSGVHHYFVEQEPPFPDGRLAAAQRNAGFLRALTVPR